MCSGLLHKLGQRPWWILGLMSYRTYPHGHMYFIKEFLCSDSTCIGLIELIISLDIFSKNVLLNMMIKICLALNSAH